MVQVRRCVRKPVTVMLAFMITFGSVSFAIPLAIPVAHASHNANLFVSAENPTFSNYFVGPQIVEVVIVDSTISDVSSPVGEPDVTVNGRDIRMVQATDGNWYGYFADKSQAQIADQIYFESGVSGVGMDFGAFCASNTISLGPSFSDTAGVAVPRSVLSGATNGNSALNTCTGTPSGSIINHVVREPKSINTDPGAAGTGQIGLDANAWPIIQLYDFNPAGSVVITYSKGGDVQSTTLTFDTVDIFAVHTLDRIVYPQNAEVFVSITDTQLNIDPTDEDSWTWDTSGTGKVFYQAFDENGNNDANGGVGLVDLTSDLTNLMFEDNGKLLVDSAAGGVTVVEFTKNDLQKTPVSDGTTLFPNAMTLREISPNAGIFSNSDSSDDSNLDVLIDAQRGRQFTITYNDVANTGLVGFNFGTISLGTPTGDWSSGEEISVTLTDGDANKNSRIDEDLDVFRSDAVIPSLITGSPITLENAASVKMYALSADVLTGGTSIPSSVPDTISDILVLDTRSVVNQSFEKISIDLGISATQLQNTLIGTGVGSSGTNWINYDFRSIQNQLDITDFSDTSMQLYFGLTDPNPVVIADVGDLTGSQGLIQIDDADVASIATKSGQVFVVINFDSSDNSASQGIISAEIDTQPIIFDIFSFGFLSDGQSSSERINNAIYRFELEETGDATNVFEGTVKFVMLNQLNILDPATYGGLSTIADDVMFVVHEGMNDAGAPLVRYIDLGADGILTEIADQEDAPTHTGTVSFNSASYGVGSTVTVTLSDPDLDTAATLIDIYTVVPPNVAEIASETVGKADLPVLSSGIELGNMVEISFGNQRWVNGIPYCGSAGTPIDGLHSSGFTLVEDNLSSGTFLGNFDIPVDFCDTFTTLIVPTQVKPLSANYVDFRDSSNQITLVSSSSFIRGTSGSIESATESGLVSFSTSAGEFSALSAISEGALPISGKPMGVLFPHGFFDWTVTGLAPSSTITLTLTYPSPVPVGTQYWKVIDSTWTDVTSLLGDDDGDDTITLTITDGGLGDADGLVNGEISDPGGVAQVLPANGKIAFFSQRDGNDEIYVMNADGTSQTRLTNNAVYDQSPSWSPDGNKIVFTSGSEGSFEIHTMNADGTGQITLTNNVVHDLDPSWSPDGNKIVFVSYRDGNEEIYVMNADGTAQTNISNNADFDNSPSWSPDGTKIAFASFRDGNYEIYVMNADGSGQTRLTNNIADDLEPSWSPDGTKIAFRSDRDGNTEIYVMNADGSGQTNISNNASGDFIPSWSPDGTKIVFVSGRDGNAEIYVMNADGSGQTRLTNVVDLDSGPSWGTAPNTFNNEPIANPDLYIAFEGMNVLIEPLLNDKDNESDPITITGFDITSTLGLVINNGDGTFTYTPSATPSPSTDSFTYTISDGTYESTGIITITRKTFNLINELDEPIILSPQSGLVQVSSSPQIISNEPNVYVHYLNGTMNGELSIIFKSSNDGGNTFGRSIKVASGLFESDLHEAAIDTNNVYMIWSESISVSDADVFLVASNDNGNTFNAITNLSNGGGKSKQPQVAADNGMVHTVWVDDTTGEVMYRNSNDGGNTFGPRLNLNTLGTIAVHPQIAASGNNIVVMWNSVNFSPSENTIVYVSSNNGGATFSPVQTLSSSIDNLTPKLEALNSNFYAAWIDRSGANYEVILRISTDDGSTFGPEINVSNSAENSIVQKLVPVGNSVHILWEENDNGQRSIMHARIDNAGTLTNGPTDLTSGTLISGVSDMAVFENDVSVIWTDVNSGTNVLLQSMDGGTIFGSLITVSESADLPHVAAEHLVFRDITDNLQSIVFRAVNKLPSVTTPIADVSVFEDAVPTIIDLSTHFDVGDGTSLTYIVDSNTNPALVSASITGSTLTLTYAADATGTTDITILAADSVIPSNSVTDTFTVTITPTNDIPTVLNDDYLVVQDTQLTLNAQNGVLSNDIDVDGDPLASTLNTPPADGIITLNPDGSFTYQPNSGFLGTDTFTYDTSDGNGGLATGTVTFTVRTPTSTQTLIVCEDFTVDDDADFICDPWEDADGILINSLDGQALSTPYRFPPSGTCSGTECPDPGIPDVYVEVDWMENQAPDEDAINQIIQAFAAKGVRLHIQFDESIGSQIDQISVPGINQIDGSFDPDGFAAIKQNFFGTAQERQLALADPKYLEAKRQFFHYALFIHQQAGDPTSSGWAEIPGNDFVVSLGSFGVAGTPSEGVGTPSEQAGTFMHELGHNLGLYHGGALASNHDGVPGLTAADFEADNCKPNYLSVMSYSFQFPYYLASRPLDYSRSTLGTLDEKSLVEDSGISTSTPAGLSTIYGPPSYNTSPTGVAINWDRDQTTGGTATNVNVNDLGIMGCSSPLDDSVLVGFNDWNSLQYNFRIRPNFDSGISVMGPFVELSSDTVDEIRENVVEHQGSLFDAIPDGAFSGDPADTRALLHDKLDEILLLIQSDDLASALQKIDELIILMPSLISDQTELQKILDSLDNWKQTIELGLEVPEPVQTAELFCNDMTIEQLIGSGSYNVIDNRDRHLGKNVKGTNGDDLILLSNEGDKANARQGNDCVIGGAGNDNIQGNKGNDQIFGNEGNDKLSGNEGNDILYGGDGNDNIQGGKADDQISGQAGNDKIHGNQGDDLISGGSDDDKIHGGQGNDLISGGNGNDTIHGHQGADTINGDDGNDKIHGGQGNDAIDGGAGNNKCNGGQGNNTVTNCTEDKKMADKDEEPEDPEED